MTPPANSKTKKPRTMKNCAVIIYYIVSITTQLKSLNSHCSIVYSHYSIVCLVTKNGLKKRSNFQVLRRKTTFTRLIALSTRFPKIFFPGRDGRIIEGKWAITRTSIVMQIKGWAILKENISLYPWYQNPCGASIFLHARPNFWKKI